jgi:hypothetical protein
MSEGWSMRTWPVGRFLLVAAIVLVACGAITAIVLAVTD